MRPDWATGPEWEGWKDASRTKEKAVGRLRLEVDQSGSLDIHYNILGGEEYIFIQCKSPEAARKAAEALLEAME